MTAGAITSSSLQSRLDALRARVRSMMPPDKLERADRAHAELLRANVAADALRVGDAAPAFELPDARERLLSSAELLARCPLVVSFFRGRWDPYCNAELEAWQGTLDELRALGAELVAISPQLPKHTQAMAQQYALRFPLLSDAGNRVARQFGIVFALPAEMKALYQSVMISLPAYNGDQSWELPVPATFVIGRDGRIAYACALADATQRAEPADVIAAVRASLARP